MKRPIFALLLVAGLGAAAFGIHRATAAVPRMLHEAPETYEVVKSDAEWREELTAGEFRILREAGTERAFTGEFWDHKAEGIYSCAGCGQQLFSSEHKFRSGTGWPSYTQPVDSDALAAETDTTLGMSRTEVLCGRCGGHLGHVFPDGPAPTGLRYCINSAALDFEPAVSEEDPSAP